MSANNFSLRSSAKAVWIKRGLGLAVLLGFAWLVISAVSTDINDEELAPVVVKAPELIKQRPETPGGMKIDHQDKQLFDLLESETSVDPVNVAVIAKAKDSETKSAELAKQAIEKKQLAEQFAKQQIEAQKQAALKAKQEAELAAKKAADAVKAKAELAAKKAETSKVVTKPVAKPATKAETKVATKTTTSGWAVQLGSFRKDADAKRAVGVYNKKVGNILSGLTPYVKKVDLGAKGIVYRVYFTGLKDRDHAKQICQQLKVQKQACLRAKI